MSPHRLKSYSLLLIVSAIWGIATPIIKFTLGEFSPLIFLFYRFSVSTFLAIVLFITIGFKIPKKPKNLLLMLLYGFTTSTLSLGLLFFGLKDTTVLDSSLITLANPLIITLAGMIFLNERVTKRERLGIAIAVVGTVLTVIEPVLQNTNGAGFSGNILIVGYVLINTLGVVLAKKLLRQGTDPLTMTNFSFIIGFVTLLPFALPEVLSSGFGIITSPSFEYHLGVIYMAVISGSLAYYLSNKAQKTIEISEQSLFAYLYPVFSMPLAVFWLGEKITPLFIIGATVIATGVLLAEYKMNLKKV